MLKWVQHLDKCAGCCTRLEGSSCSRTRPSCDPSRLKRQTQEMCWGAACCCLTGLPTPLLPHLQVALAPPEVQIDLQQQQEYEKQLQEAAAMPLPDGDDDDIAE